MVVQCLVLFKGFSKTNLADDKNLCPWAMRSLLIEDGKRLILIDNGIGDKQDDKFLRHYYLHGKENLHQSLNKYGFHADDITDVFLTHLHFDHCGGSVYVGVKTKGYEMTFKNANYWSNKNNIGTGPLIQTNREKASFLKEKYITNTRVRTSIFC